MTGSGSIGSQPKRWHWCWVLILLTLAAGLRVASTYSVFSETADEHHFVAGVEWWDRGLYSYTIYHPPLARIASALPVYLAGARAHDLSDIVEEKNAILYGDGGYVRNLSLARLGILPFLVVAIVSVWVWARRLAGDAAAFLAVLLFSTLPPVLAHSGLATTDAALMAMLTLALFAYCLWLEEPTPQRALFLGAAGGLAILSKFSAFPFFFWSALTIGAIRALAQRRLALASPTPLRRRIASLSAAAAVAAIVVWAGYRFSWGTMPATMGTAAREILVGPAAASLNGIHLPAPEFWEGLRRIRVYLRGGHPAYLLGRYSFTGWWYYFPIALAVKTPLPFLILVGAGLPLIDRFRASKDWRMLAPLGAAAAILVSTLVSRVDIGVRHILPIYPPLAIAAGCGVLRLWHRSRGTWAARVAVVLLIGWQLADSIRAHPDYLAHFNELAGRHPDRILLDSNLDWGQDLFRLSRELEVRKVDSIALAYFGNADLSKHGLPPIRTLPPDHPITGWVAISEMWLKDVAGQGQAYRWLREREPVARVGRSILLYYFPPEASR